MKRRIGTIAAVTLVLALTACGEQSAGTGTDTQVQEEQQKEQTDNQQNPDDEGKGDSSKEDTSEDNADGTEGQTEEDLRDDTANQREIEVYSSNEDATELVTTLAVIPDLTAANILNELAYKNVIPAEVTANDCELVEKDGKRLLNVDLSGEFADYLNHQGTTGEMITMGSVCNTFLKAYVCDGIKITIDGNVLETGHAEYAGYQEFVESVR